MGSTLLKGTFLHEGASLIVSLKQSAESANYVSQGQVPVLQGTSPLVTYEISLERCRRGIGLVRQHQLRAFECNGSIYERVVHSNINVDMEEALKYLETFRYMRLKNA
jgi:hypothetical protein